MLAVAASVMLRIVKPLILFPALSAYKMMLVRYRIAFASSLVYGCFIFGFPFLLLVGFGVFRTRCLLRILFRLVPAVFCVRLVVVFSCL